jgi:hypothetical protein
VERTGRNGIIHLSRTDLIVGVSISKMEYFMQRLEAYFSGKTRLQTGTVGQ